MTLLPGYTLIGEFGDLNYVALLKSRFEAAGIHCIVLDEYRTAWRGFPVYSSGLGVRVLVRDEQVEEARALFATDIG